MTEVLFTTDKTITMKGGMLLDGVGQPVLDRKKRRKGGDIDWGSVLDKVKGGLENIGKPFEATAGVNPVSAGYSLGKEVLGPALVPDDFTFKKAFGGGIKKRPYVSKDVVL